MDTSKNSEKEESLTERSARLEAEAAGLADKETQRTEDTLAPETLNDDHEYESKAPESHIADADIEAMQNELETAKEQAVRALAEAENTRRRAQKEREDATKYAVSSFAKDLLDVSDNLRRALEAVPTDLLDTQPQVKNLVDGIEATERTLLRTFEKHGIKKLEPLDELFDPNFHEVMFEAPAPGKPSGIVMQVIEPGYTLNDRLLKPARVGVTKDDGSPTSTQGDPPAGGHIDTKA